MTDDSAADSNTSVKLFHLIQNADKQILCKVVEKMTKWVSFHFLVFHAQISSCPLLDWLQHIFWYLSFCLIETGRRIWKTIESNWMFLFFYFSQIGLNPTAVKEEVELLKQWCTDGETEILKSLRYTSGVNYLHISLMILMLDHPKHQNSALWGYNNMEVITCVPLYRVSSLQMLFASLQGVCLDLTDLHPSVLNLH